MQLAAVVQRCKRIEREATKKAEACFKEQEKRLKTQLAESQRLRIEDEKAKKSAQESYAAAEAA